VHKIYPKICTSMHFSSVTANKITTSRQVKLTTWTVTKSQLNSSIARNQRSCSQFGLHILLVEVGRNEKKVVGVLDFLSLSIFVFVSVSLASQNFQRVDQSKIHMGRVVSGFKLLGGKSDAPLRGRTVDLSVPLAIVRDELSWRVTAECSTY
jgi:hypothetical protein